MISKQIQFNAKELTSHAIGLLHCHPNRGSNNVRLALNSGQKKTFFTAKRPHLLALNAVKFCKISAEISGDFLYLRFLAVNFFHRISGEKNFFTA